MSENLRSAMSPTPSPSPGILNDVNDRESREQSNRKTVEEINKDIRVAAMSVCATSTHSELDYGLKTISEEKDKGENIALDPTSTVVSPTRSNNDSEVSATSSHKENAAPRKKVNSQRNLTTMTYSSKKRRKRQNGKPNEAVTISGSKRGRRPSTCSSTTSEIKVQPEVKQEHSSDSESSEDTSSEDSDSDEEDVYVVERIDGKQVIDGTTYYYIKWKGWNESANTWEPVEHLDGCSELLENFEKQEAERRSRRKSTIKRRKEHDSDGDDDQLEETEKFMKTYGILPEWPADKEPISVEGVLTVDGTLTYVVKRKARQGSRHLDRTNAILVHSDSFRKLYPELIIKFYESRVIWNDNEKGDDEKATIAAAMTLMAQNKGTKVGKEIVECVDNEIQVKYEGMEEDFPPSSEQLEITNKCDLETQLICEDEEMLEMHAPPASKLVSIVKVEDDGTANSKYETDRFGLPEDLEDTDVSTDSDVELEEQTLALHHSNRTDIA